MSDFFSVPIGLNHGLALHSSVTNPVNQALMEHPRAVNLLESRFKSTDLHDSTNTANSSASSSSRKTAAVLVEMWCKSTGTIND